MPFSANERPERYVVLLTKVRRVQPRGERPLPSGEGSGCVAALTKVCGVGEPARPALGHSVAQELSHYPAFGAVVVDVDPFFAAGALFHLAVACDVCTVGDLKLDIVSP